MAATIALRFPAACQGCGIEIAEGQQGYYRKRHGVRCVACGPHVLVALETYREGEFTVTVIPPVKHRSTLKPIMSKAEVRAAGIARSQGGSTNASGNRKRNRRRGRRLKRPPP